VKFDLSSQGSETPCPNCGNSLGLGKGEAFRDAAKVGLRRRMLKAGVVLMAVVLVLGLIIFGAPGMSKVELTMIVALAAILFGPRLFQAFTRARRFWPFRHR